MHVEVLRVIRVRKPGSARGHVVLRAEKRGMSRRALVILRFEETPRGEHLTRTDANGESILPRG